MPFQHFKRILLLLISASIVFLILSWQPVSLISGNGKQGGKEQEGHSNKSVRHTYANLTPTTIVFAPKDSTSSGALKSDHVPHSQVVTSTRGAPATVLETPIPLIYKKDFLKMPEWDFDDVYKQDADHRETTCPQSLWKSADQSFKQASIPKVCLYLHKDNLNMREWNKLSHFNSPFGFMEYKYDDVMPAVRLIPKPKEPLLRPKRDSDGCVSCAVVGTAGILNGSGMGREIDAHDYVFRMNGAVTKGYEDDVGNKTDVYVHTAHSITASLVFFKKYGFKEIPHDQGIKYVMIPEGIRDFQWLQGLLSKQRVTEGQYKNLRPWTYYPGQFNENRFYVLHPDFLRYVRNRFLKSPQLNASYWPIVRPTNGAFTVFLALHTCDMVDIYGFMTEDYKKYNNYYFERQTKTHVIFYSNHDYIQELNLWKTFHNTKVFKLYQRKEQNVTEKPKR
ncbi:alpha-N-acetylgalactosaminide alpha-2,6-sialyltransferase 1-like [Genypterus blacodes]|uniref:alpha-N-acetylgalactosaminide alpha-2,6-sialyltransferase 1-like n=1 Tax=Genypterus blacodes TaxID=154954 RepID=UPI003F75C54D